MTGERKEMLPVWPIWAAYGAVLLTAIVFNGNLKTAGLWSVAAVAGTAAVLLYNKKR